MSKLLFAAVAVVAAGAAVGAAVYNKHYREPMPDLAWRDRLEEYPYRQ